MTANLPKLAITTGDPAGIGPEVALRAFHDDRVRQCCVPLLFGDGSVLSKVAEKLQLPPPESIVRLSNVDLAKASFSKPLLIDFESISCEDFQPQHVNARTGHSAFLYFDSAITAAIQGSIDGIVTGPLNKEAMHAAGHHYPGHTEILAERLGTEEFCMMLTSQSISCSIVTTHVGYSDVPKLLSVERIFQTIQLTHDALTRMRGREVQLVCCGLNPHAGENGLFGNREEENLIVPALELARSKGIEIAGPFPADTAFRRELREQTDGYICMYHDQGLIPLKALAFDDAVNISLGLPIVRTSVDHGTACDIAWQGKANVSSMIEAIQLAAQLAN